MRSTLSPLAIVLPFLFTACASPDAGPGSHGRPPSGGPVPSSGPSSGPILPHAPAGPGRVPVFAAGWTDDGHLAVFRVATGAIAARAGGPAALGERDLAIDPWQSRVLVLDGADIASHSFARSGAAVALGERELQGSASGAARLAASPFGALIFEDGAEGGGSRWRLLSEGAGPAASVQAPPPASLASAVLPDGRLRLTALTRGAGGAADLRIALVAPGGMGPVVTVPLVDPPISMPSSARWVQTAGGGQVVDATEGEVLVSTFAGSGYSPYMPAGVGPGIERIEQAVSFAGGARLALLTSGEKDVVVLTVGAGGAPECAAALDLPGEAAEASPFFGRGLVPVGADRVLAATSSGVFAVTISSDCPPELAVDPTFDGAALRGPLDVLPP